MPNEPRLGQRSVSCDGFGCRLPDVAWVKTGGFGVVEPRVVVLAFCGKAVACGNARLMRSASLRREDADRPLTVEDSSSGLRVVANFSSVHAQPAQTMGACAVPRVLEVGVACACILAEVKCENCHRSTNDSWPGLQPMYWHRGREP